MRLKLEIAYHGGAFEGWQSQAAGNTIQDHLERAFANLCGCRIVVYGAGRTDSGVHAEAQCAHADVDDDRLPLQAWVPALNAHLPDDIRVIEVIAASEDFHARFSAKGKIYRYTVWNHPVMHPLLRDRAWHVPREIDQRCLREACALFTGRHDFAAFSLRRTKEPEQTIRTISSIQAEIHGPQIQLTFEGEGFLYKMVRMISAAIIRHSTGKVRLQDLKNGLQDGAPTFGLVAPACGLSLVRVLYEDSNSQAENVAA
jgi:tRNA pseudouridine38-40 synthase